MENNEPIQNVLTQYVIENANLKIQIEQLKKELEESKKDKKEVE